MGLIEKGLNSVGNFVQKAESLELEFTSNDEFRGSWEYSEEDCAAFKQTIIEPANKKLCRSAKFKVEKMNLKAITGVEVLTEEKSSSIKNLTKGAVVGAGLGVMTVGAGVGAMAGAAIKATDKIFLVEVTFSNKKKTCAYMSRKIYEAVLVFVRGRDSDENSTTVIEARVYGGVINENLLKEKKRDKILLLIIFVSVVAVCIYSGIE